MVMGVCGSGKSDAGRAVSAALNGRSPAGHALRVAEGAAGMAAGAPLDDDGRWLWADRLAAALRADPPPAVVACSALKRGCRDRIRAGVGAGVHLVHLAGPRGLVAQGMTGRSGRQAPATRLESRLATLEPAQDDEAAIDRPVARLVRAIWAAVGRDGR